MRLKTSSSKGLFSPALFRNDLSRYWPLWALYLAAWLVAMPSVQLLALFGHSRRWMDAAQLHTNALKTVAGMATDGALIMSVAFGCLFAMALFAYLTSPRAVGFAHALPARREGMFLTHYLCGTAVFTAIHAAAALLTAAVWAAAGVRELWMLGVWFLSATGQMLFFYSFAVLCAIFAGQLLAIPVFYGVFNGLAAGLTYLIQLLCQTLIYGWRSSDIMAPVIWLTPVYKLNGVFQDLWRYDDQGLWGGARLSMFEGSLGVVCVYAVAGVALAGVALLAYRRRGSETAGDTVAVVWARPIFRYGVGVCAALSFGQFLYIILRDASDGSGSEASAPALAVCMVLLGLVGYFTAEMLLQKSFRVLKRSWKGGAVLSAALALVCAVFSTGFAGVGNYVPTADEVKSLNFDLYGTEYVQGVVTDPGIIGRFLTLHRTVVEERPGRDQGSENPVYASLRLSYTLKNGREFSRYYDFTCTPDQVKEKDSVPAQMAALLKDPAVGRADLESRFLNGVDRLTSAEITLDDLGTSAFRTLNFDADTAQTLVDALKKDVDAGHLGADAFDERAYHTDTYSNHLTFYYLAKAGSDYAWRGKNASFDLEFSKNDTYLLAALGQAGVDVGQLMSYEDASAPAAAEAATSENASIAVIGGADGPTEILVAPAQAEAAAQGS